MRVQFIRSRLRWVTVGLAVASALLSEPPVVASAELRTGNYWLRMCSMNVPSECLALIEGLHGMHEAKEGPRLYCAPLGITFGQMQSVVLKYLQDNPAQLQYESVDLAIVALQRAFPCPRISK